MQKRSDLDTNSTLHFQNTIFMEEVVVTTEDKKGGQTSLMVCFIPET